MCHLTNIPTGVSHFEPYTPIGLTYVIQFECCGCGGNCDLKWQCITIGYKILFCCKIILTFPICTNTCYYMELMFRYMRALHISIGPGLVCLYYKDIDIVHHASNKKIIYLDDYEHTSLCLCWSFYDDNTIGDLGAIKQFPYNKKALPVQLLDLQLRTLVLWRKQQIYFKETINIYLCTVSYVCHLYRVWVSPAVCWL